MDSTSQEQIATSLAVRSNVKVHHLVGTHREQGRQLGREVRSDIIQNIKRVAAIRRQITDTGVSEGVYEKALADNAAFVGRESPETIEEIQAIAEGANIPYARLLDLNLQTYFPLARLQAECSQIYLGPNRGRDGTSFLAKTRDLPIAGPKHTVLHRKYPNGTEIAEVIYAGAITTSGSGMNSSGLALSTSGVWGPRMTYSTKNASAGWNLINPHVLLKGARTAREMGQLLNDMPRLTSMNLIGADDSTAFLYEVAPHGIARAIARDDGLATTNHCLDPALRLLSPDVSQNPSSYARRARLDHLAIQTSDWTVETLWQVMQDHEGYPQNSICRHAAGDRLLSQTYYASIADIRNRTFFAVLGQPCEHGIPQEEQIARTVEEDA